MTALVADALVAVAHGSTGEARLVARRAAEADPSSVLAAALAEHLDRPDGGGVYDEPSGFEQFIEGGGNPRLYARTSEEIRRVHRSAAPAAVLDVGCGDGRVTAAVLGPGTRTVDLVEPSAELLASATARLQDLGIVVRSHPVTVQQHLDALDAAAAAQRWDLVQSTFALHTSPPTERDDVLRRLAARTSRLLVAEFDVPAFDDRSAEHAAYAAERYERGLREHAAQPAVVKGFLLPVLVGQFDAGRGRHTFEQPIDAWMEQLAAAGFDDVTTTPLADFWWAPAVLLDARRT